MVSLCVNDLYSLFEAHFIGAKSLKCHTTLLTEHLLPLLSLDLAHLTASLIAVKVNQTE